jgi:hypothetical protein
MKDERAAMAAFQNGAYHLGDNVDPEGRASILG